MGRIGGHPAEENQVVAPILQPRCQRMGYSKAVDRNLLGLQLDRPGGTHGESLPEGLLHSVRPEGEHHGFAAVLFHQLQADFEGIAVEVTHLILEAAPVQCFPIARDREAHLHVRYAFDADGDFQFVLPS